MAVASKSGIRIFFDRSFPMRPGKARKESAFFAAACAIKIQKIMKCKNQS